MRRTLRGSRLPARVCGPTSPNTKWQTIDRLIDGRANPTIIPSHILWCRGDGEAEQWLRHENLLWWFPASLIDYCFRVHQSHYLHGKKHGSNYKRLLARLRTHPIRDYELIGELGYYYDHYPAHGQIKFGLVNTDDLAEDAIPEITVLCVQEELYRLLFNHEEREAHQLPAKFYGPRKPCPKISFALPVALAEQKQAVDAFDAPSNFVLPIHCGPRPIDDVMAVSEIASSARSDDDIDETSPRNVLPKSTTTLLHLSPNTPSSHRSAPYPFTTAAKIPYTADLSVCLGPYQFHEAGREGYEDARHSAVGGVMDRVCRLRAEEEEGDAVISRVPEGQKHNRFSNTVSNAKELWHGNRGSRKS